MGMAVDRRRQVPLLIANRSKPLNIAVVGSGISGLGAAWLLSARHDVELFEARPRLGGHTHTVHVDGPDGALGLDTGFMIFNRTTYPLLTRLFDRLEIPSQSTDMSFSVECGACRLVYSGRGWRGLLAQPSNAVRPRFLGMLNDIRRFAQQAGSLPEGEERTLEAFLGDESFGREFRDHYLIPMAAALWSAGPGVVRRFPIHVLLAFFARHGLLRTRDRLDWQTVPGGSSRYVRAMADRLDGRIRLGAPVERVRRNGRGVSLRVGETDLVYDHVVLATHADQALGLLEEPTDAERELLSAWRYSANDTWLHTDERLLPRPVATRSAWNYRVSDCRDPANRVTATYGLNRLQRLDASTQYLVTLNPSTAPADGRVIARMRYRHPMMTPESTGTWGELPALNGAGRVWFCGSYFGFGFHEDGLRSAVDVAAALGCVGP